MLNTIRLDYPHPLFVLGILFTLFYRSNSLTSAPVISPALKYINISTVTFSTTNSFGTGLTNLQPYTYFHTFPYAKADINYRTGVSVAQINYAVPGNKALNYSLFVNGKTTTKVNINIYTNNPTRISTFVVYVIIVQSGFMGLFFNYLYHNVVGLSFAPGQNITTTWTVTIPTTFTGASTTIYSSIIGIDAFLGSGNQIGLTTSVSLIAQTTLQTVVKSIASTAITLNSITILTFIFDNSKLILQIPPARYTWGTFSDKTGNNNKLIATSNANIIRNYNTVIGLTQLWLKSSTFNYNCFVNPSVSVAANSTSSWKSFVFNYLIFQFYYCPETTPYLMVATNICYDICAFRYYSNNQLYECTACPTVDCYYCGIDGLCISCDSTLDFRYLNTTTMRCLPLTGYYETGISAAAPCVPTNCLTCTSQTVCLSCYVGKYLAADSTCALCMPNCYNCSTVSTCIQCNTNFIYISSTCIANCPNVTNCNTCTANSTLVTCLTCLPGHSLVNNTCIQVCGDGMIMTPELCDDGNLTPNDGCSSTCIIETTFYCNTTINPSICGHCIADCDNCTNSTVCTLCSTGYTVSNGSCTADCSIITNCSTCIYNSTIAITTCIACQLGYNIQSNNTCLSQCGDSIKVSPEGCDDGVFNGSGCLSNCTIATGFYCVDSYPNSSICGKCIDSCSICTDNSACSTCDTGYVYNSTACIVDCSLVMNCSTCIYNGSIICTNCALGYELNNSTNTCTSQCGDGMKVYPQECDDGGVTSDNGCSSNCTIEPGYYCVDIFPNASTCASCINSCSICSNNSTCTTCNTGYFFNSTVCIVDCSSITNCSQCIYNGTVECTTCTLGYQLNSSSNTCVTKCGDGVRVSPEGCDDGQISNGDGCSSNCTIQTGYFCIDAYPNASLCEECIEFCSVCSDNQTCRTCNMGYAYNGTVCSIDCSPISNCSICTYNGSTQCTNCSLGYYLSNTNTCDPKCGDGFIIGNQSCDDNNTVNNDGCSSACQLQAGFYCNNITISGGEQSNCSSCIAFCSKCSNNTACDQCLNSFYVYSPSNISCDINCSSITYCTACNYTVTLNCISCPLGYYITTNSCKNRCGDGILVLEQGCDDGNTNNGDGCSSVCVLQQSFFCTNITSNGSSSTSCTKCLLNCFNCSENVNNCVQCVTGYLYNSGVNVTCDVDCNVFLDCATCIPQKCLTCSLGYTLNGNCTPTCGDGLILVGQLCDDNNTIDNDGCSSTCQIQSNFVCNPINGISVCQLLTWSLDFVSLLKAPDTNSFAIQYQITPWTPIAFSSLDWQSVVYQQSNLSLSFKSINYDNATGQLSINIDYSQNLNYQTLQIGFNFPATAPFKLINATNTSTVLVSDNNLSLQVYSDDIYSNSKLLEYLAMGSSILALVVFILGYFSGKLIGLECITVFQLTFLSLLTFEDLSPSFGALSKLSYSCGYNLKNIQSSTVKIGRRFNPVNFSEPFLSNYNVTLALFAVPFILSFVLYIVNRCKYESKHQTLTKYSQVLRGEYSFYGLIFSAYQIVLSLGIQVGNIGSGMIGLVIGGILTVVIIIYGILLHKYPQIFGEFTQKFEQESCIQSHYYCFLILERLITIGSLLMVALNPQASVIIVLLLIQITLVLWKKPYKGEGAWVRPFLNLIISFLIIIIFLLNPIIGKSMSIYTAYAPFIVILLLFITLTYNIYFFIKNIRAKSEQTLQKSVKQNEQDMFMKQQFKKLNLFQQKMINPMLDRSGSPQILHQQQQSPGDVLNSLRHQLQKVKQGAENQYLGLDNQLCFDVDGQI